jgi:hypothetical protein
MAMSCRPSGSLSLSTARFRLQCFKKRTPNPALQRMLGDKAAQRP